MMMDDDKDPAVDAGTDNTPAVDATPETPPTQEAPATELEAKAVGEVKETAEAVAADATADIVIGTDEDTTSTAKVIRKESTKVAVVLTEEVKEEGVEIDEADQSGATGEGHADFNWNMTTRSAASRYTSEERAAMEKQYEDSMTNISEAEIMSAKVSSIIDGDVILDLNYKSDGLLPLSEFRDQAELAVGDTVEVYVEMQEDEKGQLVLSRRKAKLLRAWDRIRDSYANGTVINGKVISKTKGGLIADCGGLETFLPGSQIDIKPIVDYDAYVGKTMEFKVVKINETIKNAVVSHKALIESDLAEQREAIIASLERGQVLEGIVKNITDFGAFLDLGGVDGLLYITDISWGRINHPSDVLELNQKVNVAVLDFDENKKRISLGLKQLQKHPWEVLDETIGEGSTVDGKVVNIEDYGAFLEIQPGVEGLVHVSEVTKRFGHPSEFTKVGSDIQVMVLEVDEDNRKMSLGHKQLEENPWETFENVFPEGSYHEATVLRKDDRGAIVQMPYGLEAYAPIKLMRKEDGTIADVDETLTVKVIEFDRDSKRLTVSHSRYVNDIRKEAKDQVYREEKQERDNTRKVLKKTSASIERSTLGDLSAFEQLREQLSNNDDDKK